MHSSSSSSRPYRRNTTYEYHDVANMTHCKCQPPYPLPVKVSWTRRNPGRRYKGCPVDTCGVYGFLDPELPSQYYKDLFWAEHEEKKALLNDQGGVVSNSEESLQVIGILEKEMKELKSKSKVHDTLMLLLGCLVVMFLIVLCLFY